VLRRDQHALVDLLVGARYPSRCPHRPPAEAARGGHYRHPRQRSNV